MRDTDLPKYEELRLLIGVAGFTLLGALRNAALKVSLWCRWDAEPPKTLWIPDWLLAQSTVLDGPGENGTK